MNPPLPRQVVEMMASRPHRLHHWLWHQVRNSWYSYPDDVQKKVEELGWKPPRPVFNERGEPDVTNNSGEDFLYMHRQMIADVNAVLDAVSDPLYPRIQPWVAPPPPDDPDFPIPPAWVDPTGQVIPFDRLERVKSDIFYAKRMRGWQSFFTNPGFLRSVTLGELGILIELTMHNAMHMRWAGNPAGSRSEPGATEGETIAAVWDDPRYDFLGDTYSSHVHPIFWKLHGWIDDRIEDWKAANGVFGIDHFWTGRWLGKMPGHEAEQHGEHVASAPGVHAILEKSGHAQQHGDEAEELVQVIAQSAVIHSGFVNRLSYEVW